MEKKLNSPFVRIVPERSTVEIHETEPNTHWDDFALKNASLTFEGSVLDIKGEEILWGFSMDRRWTDTMSKLPDTRYIKYGYRTIMDFFNGVKTPYVKSGWYKLAETKPYRCTMNKWFVVL